LEKPNSVFSSLLFLHEASPGATLSRLYGNLAIIASSCDLRYRRDHNPPCRRLKSPERSILLGIVKLNPETPQLGFPLSNSFSSSVTLFPIEDFFMRTGQCGFFSHLSPSPPQFKGSILCPFTLKPTLLSSWPDFVSNLLTVFFLSSPIRVFFGTSSKMSFLVLHLPGRSFLPCARWHLKCSTCVRPRSPVSSPPFF